MNEPSATQDIDQLYAERAKVNRRIYDIEQAERDDKNAALVGKCFKYRNSYSMPERESDYWWLYLLVVSAKGGHLQTFTFEKDKYGDVRISRDKHLPQISDGYRPIKRTEFNAAWKGLLRHIVCVATASLTRVRGSA